MPNVKFVAWVGECLNDLGTYVIIGLPCFVSFLETVEMPALSAHQPVVGAVQQLASLQISHASAVAHARLHRTCVAFHGAFCRYCHKFLLLPSRNLSAGALGSTYHQ